MLKTWRTWTWTVLLTILLLVFGASGPSAMADDACRVELSRGWSSGTGTGKIVMKNNQKQCGDALYTLPMDKVAVDVTPKPGFTGSDRFTLRAEGPDSSGRRLKLMGEILVQVNP